MSQLKIPDELKKKVDRELDFEEKIKWIDQPVPQLFSINASLFYIIIIFGIILSLSVIVLIVSSSEEVQKSEWVSFAISILPAFFIQLILLTCPFWELRRSRHTVYLITNKRAIVMEGGIPSRIINILFRFPYMIIIRKNLFQDNGTKVIKSYSPEELSNVYRRDKRKHLGDVIFQVQKATKPSGSGGESGMYYEEGFFGVRNPKQVEDIVKNLAESASN